MAAIKANGGGQLYVPPGVYLTTGFALTSHMSLFIDRNATLMGALPDNSRCDGDWPCVHTGEEELVIGRDGKGDAGMGRGMVVWFDGRK